MKVKTKKPIYYFGPHQIAKSILFWLPEYDEKGDHNDTIYNFGRKLGKYKWLVKICEWIYKQRQKYNKDYIRIDNYDIWSADYTLGCIILPVLKKLREDKTGIPYVDNDDVPSELYSDDPYMMGNNADCNLYEKRWLYVLDEMIFAFKCIAENNSIPDEFISGVSDIQNVPVDCFGNEVDEKDAKFFELRDGPNHTEKIDMEAYKKYNKRIQNGLRLFSVYYRALWT